MWRHPWPSPAPAPDVPFAAVVDAALKPLVVGADAARIAISGVFELDNAQGLAQALEQQGLVSTRREGGRIFVSRASADAPDDCRSAA